MALILSLVESCFELRDRPLDTCHFSADRSQTSNVMHATVSHKSTLYFTVITSQVRVKMSLVVLVDECFSSRMR